MRIALLLITLLTSSIVWGSESNAPKMPNAPKEIPYAKQIGYTQNWFEKLLSNNKTTKKYFKMLVQIRGVRYYEFRMLHSCHK